MKSRRCSPRTKRIAPDEGIDLGRLSFFERSKRLRDPYLECRKALRRGAHIGREIRRRTPSIAPSECTAVDFTWYVKGSMSGLKRA